MKLVRMYGSGKSHQLIKAKEYKKEQSDIL